MQNLGPGETTLEPERRALQLSQGTDQSMAGETPEHSAGSSTPSLSPHVAPNPHQNQKEDTAEWVFFGNPGPWGLPRRLPQTAGQQGVGQGRGAPF